MQSVILRCCRMGATASQPLASLDVGLSQRERPLICRLLARLRVPPSVTLLVVNALLFLVGAGSYNSAGARAMAELGVLGDVASVAVIAAFMG
jgi:hypothetical protein